MLYFNIKQYTVINNDAFLSKIQYKANTLVTLHFLRSFCYTYAINSLRQSI